MIGSKLGVYEITEEIGAGGMATVYRAYQPSMDRHVAVKLIRANILHDPTLRDRFRREARLIARLEHPHLLPVYDFDGDHDPPYIVMRFLEGGTLKQVLDQGELPHAEVLYMLRQVAASLDYAHRQGVIHRDLKPSNVMIDREGNAFVTDFGIARTADAGEDLTATGVIIGTPSYMSPEQAKGSGDISSASDIYSLGAMVFEMLTRSVPFVRDSHVEVVMAHINEDVPAASARQERLAPVVDEVIRRAMAKNPAERYASAQDLVNDLAAALRVETATRPRQLQEVTSTLSLDQLKAFEAAREKKAETPTGATPSDQQRQMTAVYVDVTELSESLYEGGADTETVRARMDELWTRFQDMAGERRGAMQSRTDEMGVFLWGRAGVNEDDPELAIRSALRMRDTVMEASRRVFGKDYEPSEENPLPFRAGIATGAVLLEREAETGSYTASGPTITLAGRLKEGAPDGGVLIDHATFTQVRGVFHLSPHDPIRLRGRKEPLEVYEVTGVKPRAFRMKARGIEGVETRMIGREIELRLLQEALTLTLEDGETQVVTVVGEAGVGKSRLRFEFQNWTELIEETVWLFEARATQPSMLQPYSLTRDLFSFRFQILDSDPIDLVHEKFVKGVAGFLGEGSETRAELIGQLVGFDFSERPAVAEALKDAESFRKEALGYLGEFFTTACEVHPVVIHLEDIHWADDRSLDLINNLVRENTKIPLFIDCLARPSLYDRRPQWGEGQHFHERIQLEPLSQLSSRRLVKELLKKVPAVPTALRDLIVGRADGNPFYIEELIKTLIDDGVIVKGEDEWSVDESRLSSVRVPPTLTGVLQSRLDTLPTDLQQMAQRVSVVGRVFWDSAANHLSREAGLDEEQTRAALEELREREMILRREESGFAGTQEFVFRHAILRDVTYETVVPRQRRALHKQVGDWLQEIGGERSKEHTLLVAEHYGHAGENELASRQLRQAADSAARLGAYGEALATLDKARTLVAGDEHRHERWLVDIKQAEIISIQGDFSGARGLLDPILPAARESGDHKLLAAALGQLARVALWTEDWDGAREYIDEAVPLVRELDDLPALMFILRQKGNVLSRTNLDEAVQYLEESRDVARKLGDTVSEGSAINSLGNVANAAGRLEDAAGFYEQAIRLGREAKNGMLEAMAMENLGAVRAQMDKDDPEAQGLLERALALNTEARENYGVATIAELLGWLHLRRGEDDEAASRLALARTHYLKTGSKPLTLVALFAVLEARTGDADRAAAWARAVNAGARGEDFEYARIRDGFPDVLGAVAEQPRDGDPTVEDIFDLLTGSTS